MPLELQELRAKRLLGDFSWAGAAQGGGIPQGSEWEPPESSASFKMRQIVLPRGYKPGSFLLDSLVLKSGLGPVKALTIPYLSF